jgi:hypothetical protein
MSATQGPFGQQSFGGNGRGYGRWSGFEILAMVLGLIVFWPIGLGVMGYKLWQKKMGGPDLQTVATSGWNYARSTMSSGETSTPKPWAYGFRSTTSGNSAFDSWKSAELQRLEQERRKLEDAHREFAEFVENVRKAKDREEFERFMNERNSKTSA